MAAWERTAGPKDQVHREQGTSLFSCVLSILILRMAPAHGIRSGTLHELQLTHVLALLAHLPSLLPNARTVLPRLMAFYTKTLEPRVENMAQSTSSGSSLVSSNGLLRKMAVKARGRWWVAMLSATMGEAGKVRRSARGRHVVPLDTQGKCKP